MYELIGFHPILRYIVLSGLLSNIKYKSETVNTISLLFKPKKV